MLLKTARGGKRKQAGSEDRGQESRGRADWGRVNMSYQSIYREVVGVISHVKGYPFIYREAVGVISHVKGYGWFVLKFTFPLISPPLPSEMQISKHIIH